MGNTMNGGAWREIKRGRVAVACGQAANAAVVAFVAEVPGAKPWTCADLDRRRRDAMYLADKILDGRVTSPEGLTDGRLQFHERTELDRRVRVLFFDVVVATAKALGFKINDSNGG